MLVKSITQVYTVLEWAKYWKIYIIYRFKITIKKNTWNILVKRYADRKTDKDVHLFICEGCVKCPLSALKLGQGHQNLNKSSLCPKVIPIREYLPTSSWDILHTRKRHIVADRVRTNTICPLHFGGVGYNHIAALHGLKLHTCFWARVLFVCLFCCFTSQVNSYGHGATVSSPNHTFSWASLNKQLTSTSCTYFRL